MLMKIRKRFSRPVVSSSSKHRISSTNPYSTLFYFGTLGAEVVLLSWLLAFTNLFELLFSRVDG